VKIPAKMFTSYKFEGVMKVGTVENKKNLKEMYLSNKNIKNQLFI
jgi:hypothetical protein